VQIRTEWLGHGLSTTPADRDTTERAISGIYAGSGRPAPRFVWVDSPRAALEHLDGAATLDDLYRAVLHPPSPGAYPFAGDVAAGLSGLRTAIEAAIVPVPFDRSLPRRTDLPKRGSLGAEDAVRAGVPFREIVEDHVRGWLQTSLGQGVHLPVRAALPLPGAQVEPDRDAPGVLRPPAMPDPPGSLQRLPVCYYGQQDAAWFATVEVWRRLGCLPHLPSAVEAHLAEWTALCLSAGWWWPGPTVCVLSDRPAEIRTEPVPGARDGEVRLARARGPAIVYRDGWSVTPR